VCTVLAASAAALVPVRAAEPPMEIKWSTLVPDAPAEKKPLQKPWWLPPRRQDGATDMPKPHGQDGRWMSRKTDAATSPPEVVKELDGKRVRLGGYVVPLDFDATTVKEFLLVPFVGACIHVPPPPPNQIVYVKAEKGFTVKEMFDPVYVTGTMKVASASTGLADAGYTLEADVVELRKK
jgi:hypothetical protein